MEKCNNFALVLSKKVGKEDGPNIRRLRGRIISIYRVVRLDINPKAKYLDVSTIWVYVDQNELDERIEEVVNQWGTIK